MQRSVDYTVEGRGRGCVMVGLIILLTPVLKHSSIHGFLLHVLLQ